MHLLAVPGFAIIRSTASSCRAIAASEIEVSELQGYLFLVMLGRGTSFPWEPARGARAKELYFNLLAG